MVGLDDRNVLVVRRLRGLYIVPTLAEPADADDIEADPPAGPVAVEVVCLAGLGVDAEPDDFALDNHEVTMAYLLGTQPGHD